MKKVMKTILCTIMLIAMIFSVTACGDDGTQKQSDDLQTQLAQQQEQLQQLEELIKQQQEQLQRFEELLEQQQEKIDRLDSPTPYEVTMGSMSDSVWCKFTGSYLFCSAEQGISFLRDVEKETHETDMLDWHIKAGDVIIDENFFNNYFVQNANKALIISVFYSPCVPADITRHSLYKQNNKLFVAIDYECGISTAIAMFAVIMEVDKDYIGDVTAVELELNK